MRQIKQVLTAALFAAMPALSPARAGSPPLVEPTFLLPVDAEASDYRPVLNPEGTIVICERTLSGAATQLYYSNLPPLAGDPKPLASLAESTRPDWCWLRSGNGQLSSGPIAFSNNDGIYVVAGIGSQPALLPGTEGMIYPSWYPDCKHLAVDVTGAQVTAEIDLGGNIIVSPLANERVWAGFPSVNQANPNRVAFSG